MKTSKFKHQNHISKIKILNFGLSFCIFIFGFWISLLCAQTNDLEFTVDAAAPSVPLPPVFKPSLDVSGRGFHQQATWPQAIASPQALDAWQRDIGFSGIYRLQYNLWEINQLAKGKDLQDKLLGNYESVIKRISDAGGIVMVSVFGTPAGMGSILDPKSPVRDLKAYKALIKKHMRYLSC